MKLSYPAPPNTGSAKQTAAQRGVRTTVHVVVKTVARPEGVVILYRCANSTVLIVHHKPDLDLIDWAINAMHPRARETVRAQLKARGLVPSDY